MGAWGAGTFDNDTAGDWSEGLNECDDLSLVINTLDRVIEIGHDYLDADAACEALGACEAIARLNGNWGPRNAYSETVDTWVNAHPTIVPPALVQKAITVINRILVPPSELLELWQEDTEWREAVEDLRARVGAKPNAIASS